MTESPYTSTVDEVKRLRKELRRCVNELCLRCGRYDEEHLGACNGCRWNDLKRDLRDERSETK